MPEGPEIWILSKAINEYYINRKTVDYYTNSYGIYLIVQDNKNNCERWSFNSSGTVFINQSNELIKKKTGWFTGEQTKFIDYYKAIEHVGTDWMSASINSLHEEVDKWITSKQKLGTMMLNQHLISGIGIHWGSEILFRAGLRPDMRCCDQVLNKLVDSMIEVRDYIVELYENELDKVKNNKELLKECINSWYANLYDIREMKICEKGSRVKVVDNYWWV